MTNNPLAGMPIQETNDESIVAHFSDGLLMHFEREETIINGIDEPEGIYLIKEGFVKAYSVSQAGHGNLLLIQRLANLYHCRGHWMEHTQQGYFMKQ